MQDLKIVYSDACMSSLVVLVSIEPADKVQTPIGCYAYLVHRTDSDTFLAFPMGRSPLFVFTFQHKSVLSQFGLCSVKSGFFLALEFDDNAASGKKMRPRKGAAPKAEAAAPAAEPVAEEAPAAPAEPAEVKE